MPNSKHTEWRNFHGLKSEDVVFIRISALGAYLVTGFQEWAFIREDRVLIRFSPFSVIHLQ